MIRLLPPEEWGRLDADFAAFCDTLHPEDVAVFVAEEFGQIVGHVAVLRAPFLERWWVSPDKFGNPGVTRGLLRAAMGQAREWAPTWLIAHGNKAMTDTLERLGGQWLDVHTTMVRHEDFAYQEEACRPQ